MEVSEESVSNYTQLPPIAYCTIQRETETETERERERETERERQTERARARERERERAERRKSGRRRARERAGERGLRGAFSHTSGNDRVDCHTAHDQPDCSFAALALLYPAHEILIACHSHVRQRLLFARPHVCAQAARQIADFFDRRLGKQDMPVHTLAPRLVRPRLARRRPAGLWPTVRLSVLHPLSAVTPYHLHIIWHGPERRTSLLVLAVPQRTPGSRHVRVRSHVRVWTSYRVLPIAEAVSLRGNGVYTVFFFWKKTFSFPIHLGIKFSPPRSLSHSFFIGPTIVT